LQQRKDNVATATPPLILSDGLVQKLKTRYPNKSIEQIIHDVIYFYCDYKGVSLPLEASDAEGQ
jgi:hypothetical protein